MTKLSATSSSPDVFSRIIMNPELTEDEYSAIENKLFHVVARAVLVGTDNSNVDTAWKQVPVGYDKY